MEPIAVIGIGCRLPGAEGPDAFWKLLREGVDAITDVPADRWVPTTYYDQDPAATGRMSTRWGGFLKQIDRFDAAFFGITPREAVHMDPQQRLLLETTWEALEDAGQSRDSVAGRSVGVFVGISTYDYGGMQLGAPDRITDGYLNTGSALSIAANRISYFFDFRGPSMAVDTACSSSLVAAHLACQSLRSGESVLAIAGGVNVILSPSVSIGFSKLRAMATDGRCKPFDARADGFVRSEGVGMVVLKLLDRAVADGDPIYAVIRDTAVNQDGRTNGLTAPNGLSQEDLLRRVLVGAGVAPSEVSYVEAHGTGTALGDPIELDALGKVLATGRPPEQRCPVGSVKSNIGHLEAAAGVAGLIKVALCLKHGEIPPSIHFQAPNPHVRFDDLPLYVQTSLSPWPDAGPRIACLSSFGFGGTNACAVLAEAPPVERADASELEADRTYLLPLSAVGEQALRALASSYCELLSPRAGASLTDGESAPPSLTDICYTAGARRTHLSDRLAVTGETAEALAEALDAFRRGESHRGWSAGRKSAGRRRKLAFVFSGHGAQWLGMGRGLLAKEAVFRDALEKCDRALRNEVSWSLVDRVLGVEGEADLQRVEVIQPVVFGIQVALAALWRHWGIEPDAVVGHSMGEVAAAHVSGSLTLEDAAKVICQRSKLLQRIAGRGAMTSVELSVDEATESLHGYEELVSIGAINGSRSTVLSGDRGAIEELTKRLESESVLCRPLQTDVAFHGPQVDPLTEPLFVALPGLRPVRSAIPLYSTVTGVSSDGSDLDASYWADNLRKPVLFATALKALVEDGHGIFVELSPHPVLLPAIQQEFRDVEVLPSVKRGDDEQLHLMSSLGRLYTLGHFVDWAGLYPGGRHAKLPSYPWQRERFWIDEPRSSSPGRPPGEELGEPRGVVSEFYDSLSQTHSMHDRGDTAVAEAYLTFAPFPQPIPGFSWLNAFFDPSQKASAQIVLEAQKELRAALFQKVDFSRVSKVLDFGCGYASDVVALSEKHEHLRVHGFTISAEQAAIGSRKARERGLGDRVRVFNRDSAADEFPDQYDVVFGFEVAGHIQDKQGLFSNVSRHLVDGGLLLMADFVANTAAAIAHDELGTYASTTTEWADDLARNGLRIVECTDISEEVANSLHDPDFDANLERLSREQFLSDVVKKNLRSFDNYGKALRRKFLSYCLFVVQRDRYLLESELFRINKEKLSSPAPYGDSVRLGAEGPDAASEASRRCLYGIEWEPKERAPERLSDSPATAAERRWIIFSDSAGVGDELSTALSKRGEGAIRVAVGTAYERRSDDLFSIRPDVREDFEHLLRDVHDSPERLAGAVHLWSLDAAPPESTTIESLAAAHDLGCASVLHWIQAVIADGRTPSPRLWVVTRNIQPVGSPTPPSPAPAQAPVWGLARAISQERPNAWGGLIALDDVPPREAAALVSREVTHPDGEDQIALGSSGRRVARLAGLPKRVGGHSELAFREDAAYLVTGGLGELGLLVSRFLVDHGARNVILLGRSKLLPRSEWDRIEKASRMYQQIGAVRAMEDLGATVHLDSVDVADEGQVDAFLERWTATGGAPIRGVVHAAGWVGLRALEDLDLELFEATLKPKVRGGWILHRRFAAQPLDFFVMFSSVASVLGLLGQGLGHYAAANAFLDGLAHYRRSLGLPALSIDWGPWSEVGMAARTGQEQRLSPHGVRSLSPERGLEILGHLLAGGAENGPPQVVAIDVEWPRLARSFPTVARAAFLSRVVGEREPERRPQAAASVSSLLSRVRDMDSAERREALETELRRRVSSVLRLSPATIDVQRSLVDMGMDSLMGVELKNQLEGELGLSLPLAELMRGASISRIASFLAEELKERGGSGVQEVSPVGSKLASPRDRTD